MSKGSYAGKIYLISETCLRRHVCSKQRFEVQDLWKRGSFLMMMMKSSSQILNFQKAHLPEAEKVQKKGRMVWLYLVTCGPREFKKKGKRSRVLDKLFSKTDTDGLSQPQVDLTWKIDDDWLYVSIWDTTPTFDGGLKDYQECTVFAEVISLQLFLKVWQHIVAWKWFGVYINQKQEIWNVTGKWRYSFTPPQRSTFGVRPHLFLGGSSSSSHTILSSYTVLPAGDHAKSFIICLLLSMFNKIWPSIHIRTLHRRALRANSTYREPCSYWSGYCLSSQKQQPWIGERLCFLKVIPVIKLTDVLGHDGSW